MSTLSTDHETTSTLTVIDDTSSNTPFYRKYRAKIQDTIWLSEILQKPVQHVSISKPADTGGHLADVFSLALTIESGKEEIKLIVKLLGKGHVLQGFEREIPVYQHFLSPLIEKGLIHVPRFYFGDYDSETGAKVVVLEELNAVHCGRFFGYTSPHNRNKDLAAMCAGFPGLTDVEITKKAFIQLAKLHGTYWCRPKDQIPGYIRGGDWLGVQSSPQSQSNQTPLAATKSIGEEQYETIIKFARDQWPTRHDKRVNCKFNKYLEDIVSYSIDNSTYESFAQILNSGPYTIIHGDFYPANALVELVEDVNGGGSVPKVSLIDFEVLSVGPGPQDLAQWMISHVHPETRLQNEMDLLRAYRAELSNVWVQVHGEEKAAEFEKGFGEKKMIEDYIAGGGKWIWLVAICVGSLDSIPDVLYQHFIDQLTHFFKTFKIEIEKNNVPGPRC